VSIIRTLTSNRFGEGSGQAAEELRKAGALSIQGKGTPRPFISAAGRGAWETMGSKSVSAGISCRNNRDILKVLS
jgi:hypothetical protein